MTFRARRALLGLGSGLCLSIALVLPAGSAAAAGEMAGTVSSASISLTPGFVFEAATPPSGSVSSPAPTLGEAACYRPGDCVAAGRYDTSSGHVLPWFVYQSGSGLQTLEPTLPAGATDGVVDSLACSSSSYCVGAGYYDIGSTSQEGLLVGYSDGRLTSTEAPLSGGGSDPNVSLAGTACSVGLFCAAVGDYSGGAVFEILSSNRWTDYPVPVPSGGSAAYLDAVSCPAVGWCEAVGQYETVNGTEGLLATWSSGAVTVAVLPLPSNASSEPDVELKDVSCPTANSCVAVGSYYLDTGVSTSAGLYSSLSSGSWVTEQDSLPTGVASGQDSLGDVTCPGVGDCVAVGNASDTDPADFLEIETDGAWSASAAPLPGSGPSYPQALSKMSCPGADSCLGTASSSSGASAQTIVVQTPGGWQAVPVPGSSPGQNVLVGDPACTGYLTCVVPATSRNAVPGLEVITPTPPCPTASGSDLGSAVGISAVDIGGCPGYFVVDRDGRVAAFGSAVTHGDLAGVSLDAPIIAITATSDGKGYWLLGADGGVFCFGDARFFGSTADTTLNAPVVGMAVTTDSRGYWVIAKDGGVFAFGDATFYGSTGDTTLNQPVDGIAVAPHGHGYWLVAGDGGVFSFTPNGFYGSLGNVKLAKPVIGMSSTSNGRGYTLVGSDGGVFNFGTSTFYGSLGSDPPSTPVVDLSPVPAGNGYYLVDSAGQVFAFGPGAKYFGNS